MNDSSHIECLVKDEMSYTLAIANILKKAKSVGFSEVGAAKIATVVSELSRNILKYASHGVVKAGLKNMGRKTAFYIIASDNGPGIKNVDEALSESYSTGGTLGMGLPGVCRMADKLKVESSELGTKVEVLIWV